jgi:hypothetical protein
MFSIPLSSVQLAKLRVSTLGGRFFVSGPEVSVSNSKLETRNLILSLTSQACTGWYETERLPPRYPSKCPSCGATRSRHMFSPVRI